MELRFSAKDLINKDLFSLSDPFLVCHTVRHGEAHQEIGRTETVQDDLNPNWATTFSFDYEPSRHSGTILVVDIFDRDSADVLTLEKHDFLGRALFQLADLLQSPKMHLNLALHAAKPNAIVKNLPTATNSSTSSSLTSAVDTDEDSSERSKLQNGQPPLYWKRSGNTDVRESKASAELRRATSGARAGKVKGSVSIFAEFVSGVPGLRLTFRVRSALLRDVYSVKSALCGRKVIQFFEIQRLRQLSSSTTWSCVYRSDDGIQVDSYNYVVFDDISMDERTLNNLQRDRMLRIAFYKRHVRSQHELICYSNWTVDEILEDGYFEKDVPFRMEGEFGDDDGLGSMYFRRESGTALLCNSPFLGANDEQNNLVVHVRADHFLNSKFVSSLNDSPRHARRLRQKSAFVSLH